MCTDSTTTVLFWYSLSTLLQVILVPNVATDPAEVADALISLTSVFLHTLA